MPSVSAIVPVYNVEKYLKECLEGIKSQTFKDFEVLCVNDGSTDSSLSIINEFISLDDRFKVIDKPNGGYGTAINAGLSAATGKYISIVESDDYVEPGMLDALVSAAENDNLDIVRANYWLYWSAGGGRNEFFEAYTEDACGYVFDPIEQKTCFYYPPALWAMLVRRDVIESNGLRLLETPGAAFQDTAFSFKLWASSKRALLLFDAYLHYRQDNENSSINQKDKAYFVCKEYEEVLRFASQSSDSNTLLPIAQKRKFDAYEWNMQRIDASLRSDFARSAALEFKEALDEGSLSKETFDEAAWGRVNLLMRDPEGYLKSVGLAADKGQGFFGRLRGFLRG